MLTAKRVRWKDRDAKRIYFEAFPKEERMPYFLMLGMSHLWNTEFLTFYDRETPVGVVYLAKNPSLVFIMFLAVDKSLRGRGYGSEILRYIGEKYGRKCVVSIEPCEEGAKDLEIRNKRKSFYLKNGYEETGYRMVLSGVEQEILISGGEFNKGQFRLFFVAYSNGTVWPRIWKTDTEKER